MPRAPAHNNRAASGAPKHKHTRKKGPRSARSNHQSRRVSWHGGYLLLRAHIGVRRSDLLLAITDWTNSRFECPGGNLKLKYKLQVHWQRVYWPTQHFWGSPRFPTTGHNNQHPHHTGHIAPSRVESPRATAFSAGIALFGFLLLHMLTVWDGDARLTKF